MKGLLLFNQSSELLFVDGDGEFYSCTYREGCPGDRKERGFEDNEFDAYMAGQMFAPIATSFMVMMQVLKNPYRKIVCENGNITVLKQLDNLLFIAVNGDGTETEEFLQRKISVFHRILKLLYGPVLKQVKPNKTEERTHRWKFLSQIMKTWYYLVSEEQSFLMEAIEQLYLNYTVNEKCLKLLEMVLKKLQGALGSSNNHALLLVKGKLLALYSSYNAYELQAADILTIMLLVQYQFPATDDLVDILSQSADSRNSHQRQKEESLAASGESLISAGKKKMDSDFGQFFSSTNSSSEISKEEPTELSEDTQNTALSLEESSDIPFHYKIASTDSEESSPTGATSRIKAQMETTCYARVDSSEIDGNTEVPRLHVSEVAIDQRIDKDEHRQLPLGIFLQTPICQFSPNELYCLQVFPGIILVIVSEQVGASQSGLICQIHELLLDIISGRSQWERLVRGNGQYTFDLINSLITRLVVSCREYQSLVDTIKVKWEDLKKKGLYSVLERRQLAEIPHKVENALVSLMEKVNSLFLGMFVYHNSLKPVIKDVLMSVKNRISEELADYKDYLLVKAQRNITITSYFSEFPGLVYFIYIDRTTNQMIAPTLNVTTADPGIQMDSMQFLKDKIWSSVRLLQKKLSQGYTSILLHDGDFLFSYFLWFEDNAHKPLAVKQPFNPLPEFPLPGLLTGNFYRQLIRQCFPSAIPQSVHCLELICVHIGLVPVEMVSVQLHQLANKLWDMAGDGLALISLL